MLTFIRRHPTTIPNVTLVARQQTACGGHKNPIGRLLLTDPPLVRRLQYPTKARLFTVDAQRIFAVFDDESLRNNTRTQSSSLKRQEDGANDHRNETK